MPTYSKFHFGLNGNNILIISQRIFLSTIYPVKNISKIYIGIKKNCKMKKALHFIF